MAKQVRTLTKIATAIVSNVNARIAAEQDMKALAAQCAALADSEKAKIDAELVNYYAAQAGVSVKAREKGEPQPGRCNLVAAWERDDEKKLTAKSNAASVALSRARAILFVIEKKEAKKAPKKASNDDTFAQLEKMAALAVKAGDKAQIKAMKQRVTAIMLMLSA